MPVFIGSGGMTYPEGEMKYIWDGRGIAGMLGASCQITDSEIRLAPNRVLRTVLGWPQLVLPLREIRTAEALFFNTYRFRSDNRLLDGACFHPVFERRRFLAALDTVGVPVLRLPWRQKLKVELRITWNQMRWGGRLRRRHWKRAPEGPFRF